MKRIFKFLLLGLAFLMLGFILIDTYALLETKGEAIVETGIGNWVIKINNLDITDTANENFVIDQFYYDANANVKNDKIAPGKHGYFDIVLDPTGTSVAVRYDITFHFESISSDLAFQARIADLSENIIQTDVNTFSGVISLEEVKSKVTNHIRVEVEWLNDETKNDADTLVGSVFGNKISIPIEIRVSQYTGETIIPYGNR